MKGERSLQDTVATPSIGAKGAGKPPPKLLPLRDPDVPHPGMEYCGGRWYTPEALEHKRKVNRERSAKKQLLPHVCDRKDCEEQAHQFTSGNFGPWCYEHHRENNARNRSNPELRRKQAIYMMFYRQRRKKERYVNEGLTLGDHGEEDCQSRNQSAA